MAARGTELGVRKVVGNSKEICKTPWKISKFPRRFAMTFSNLQGNQ